MKDADRPRRGGSQRNPAGERVDALVRREGFDLEQDVHVTELLSNVGEASDLPDALYILLAEVCSCLYRLEAAAQPDNSESAPPPPSSPARRP